MNKKMAVTFIIFLLLVISLLAFSFSRQFTKAEEQKTVQDFTQEFIEDSEFYDMRIEADVVEDKEPITDGLSTLINDYIDEQNININNISLCVHDLTSAEEVCINKDTNMVAASVYKLPLAMLYYDKIYDGELSPTSTFTFSSFHYEAGGPIANNYTFGTNLSLSYILDNLILYSDNSAGHILFENLGGWPSFKQAATKYTTTTQNSEFFSYENLLNADYTNDVLIHLYNNQDKYSNLIENMNNAEPTTYLNNSTPYITAQKYGALDYYTNSAGIVDGDFPYTICYFSANGSGEYHMGKLNELIYNYINDYYTT